MLMSLFRTVTHRLKALFLSSAALELEAEFLAHEAERRAELHRQAERYASEGLHGIAQHLRQRAEALAIERPLAQTLPALEHLLGPHVPAAGPSLQEPAAQPNPESKPRLMIPTRTRKKGR